MYFENLSVLWRVAALNSPKVKLASIAPGLYSTALKTFSFKSFKATFQTQKQKYVRAFNLNDTLPGMRIFII